MVKNYKSADFKGGKKLSGQQITKKLSLPSFCFLSRFLCLFSFVFILVACDTAASSASSLSPDVENWTQLRSARSNHFPQRSGHSSVVMDGNIYNRWIWFWW